MAELNLETDKMAAEFFGVLVLAMVGVASAGSVKADPVVAGLTLAAVVTLTMKVSGGYLNPAITLGQVFRGKMDWQVGVWYIICQSLGAVVGVIVVTQIMDHKTYGAQSTGADGMDMAKVIAAELIATAVLMWAWIASVNEGKTPGVAGFAVGIVSWGMWSIGAFSMNPGLHLGYAVNEGIHSSLWIYWVGPVLGAVVACYLYDQFCSADAEEE